jgi:hypothetical protein
MSDHFIQPETMETRQTECVVRAVCLTHIYRQLLLHPHIQTHMPWKKPLFDAEEVFTAV